MKMSEMETLRFLDPRRRKKTSEKERKKEARKRVSTGD